MASCATAKLLDAPASNKLRNLEYMHGVHLDIGFPDIGGCCDKLEVVVPPKTRQALQLLHFNIFSLELKTGEQGLSW
jgi:hypothetical protein